MASGLFIPQLDSMILRVRHLLPLSSSSSFCLISRSDYWSSRAHSLARARPNVLFADCSPKDCFSPPQHKIPCLTRSLKVAFSATRGYHVSAKCDADALPSIFIQVSALDGEISSHVDRYMIFYCFENTDKTNRFDSDWCTRQKKYKNRNTIITTKQGITFIP